RTGAIGLDKDKGRADLNGQRAIHLFDHLSQAWRSGIRRRQLRGDWPEWGHGSPLGRSRESALLALQAACWRLRDANASVAQQNRGVAGAFNALTWDHWSARAVGRPRPNDRLCFAQPLSDLYVTVATPDGALEFTLEERGAMGGSLLPWGFVATYSVAVGAAFAQVMEAEESYAWLGTKIPGKGRCNMGFTWFFEVQLRCARLPFTSYVHDPALPAPHVLPVAPGPMEELSKDPTTLLRPLIGGAFAMWKGGRQRALTNDQVRGYWELAMPEVAPEAHHQVIATVCGQCGFEDEMGIKRLGENGWPIATSTPRRHQVEEGLEEMGKVPGGMADLAYEGEVRDQFVQPDLR
ncbi:unnamed protein product, partial [Prorocentrum cordatum]